jgi:hypothetical protein
VERREKKILFVCKKHMCLNMLTFDDRLSTARQEKIRLAKKYLQLMFTHDSNNNNYACVEKLLN